MIAAPHQNKDTEDALLESGAPPPCATADIGPVYAVRNYIKRAATAFANGSREFKDWLDHEAIRTKRLVNVVVLPAGVAGSMSMLTLLGTRNWTALSSRRGLALAFPRLWWRGPRLYLTGSPVVLFVVAYLAASLG
jgi:hypothetical protein